MRHTVISIPVTQMYCIPSRVDLQKLQPALLAWLDFCKEAHYTMQLKKINLAIRYDVRQQNGAPLASLDIEAHTNSVWFSKLRTKHRQAQGLQPLPKGVASARMLLPAVFQAKLSQVTVEELCQLAILLPEFSGYLMYSLEQQFKQPIISTQELIEACKNYKQNILRYYFPEFDLIV